MRCGPAVGGRIGINARNTLSSRHVVATGNLSDDVAVFGATTANPGGMVNNKPASRVRPAVALRCTRVDDGATGAGVYGSATGTAGETEVCARMEATIARAER